MNTMIVDLMSEKLHASVKALEGYCAFQRLLIMYVLEHSALLEKANRIVSEFIQTKDNNKGKVPNLGEFLPLIGVTKYQWKDLALPYLRETFARNVRWSIEKYPELAKESPDPHIDNHRCAKTLLASTVSIRLMLFHVYFLKHVGRPDGMSLEQIADNYDTLYGRPTNKMKGQLQQAIKEIHRVNTWENVFEGIGIPCPPEPELCAWFRDSVKLSLQRRYHKPVQSSSLPRFPKPRGSGPANVPKQPGYKVGNTSKVHNTKRICKYFQESGGKTCPYGEKCHFSHVISGSRW